MAQSQVDCGRRLERTCLGSARTREGYVGYCYLVWPGLRQPRLPPSPGEGRQPKDGPDVALDAVIADGESLRYSVRPEFGNHPGDEDRGHAALRARQRVRPNHRHRRRRKPCRAREPRLIQYERLPGARRSSGAEHRVAGIPIHSLLAAVRSASSAPAAASGASTSTGIVHSQRTATAHPGRPPRAPRTRLFAGVPRPASSRTVRAGRPAIHSAARSVDQPASRRSTAPIHIGRQDREGPCRPPALSPVRERTPSR